MFTSRSKIGVSDSFSKHRAGKSSSKNKRSSFRESSFAKRPAELDLSQARQHAPAHTAPTQAQLNSAIVTLSVGASPPRLFAAHFDVLSTSPYFQSALRSQFYNPASRQLSLSSEVPEVFACVLEYLYKGDYFPRLVQTPGRQGQSNYTLENSTASPGNSDSTVWIPTSLAPASPTSTAPHPSNTSPGLGVIILKDTAVYCAADRFGLPSLKRIALRKQGLQSGVPVSTILASARYAYAHTPNSDRNLRAHYLALIIRSRSTFKKSGAMQAEMGMPSPRLGGPSTQRDQGTALWFDLFVAMCNHLDDMEVMAKSPRV